MFQSPGRADLRRPGPRRPRSAMRQAHDRWVAGRFRSPIAPTRMRTRETRVASSQRWRASTGDYCFRNDTVSGVRLPGRERRHRILDGDCCVTKRDCLIPDAPRRCLVERAPADRSAIAARSRRALPAGRSIDAGRPDAAPVEDLPPSSSRRRSPRHRIRCCGRYTLSDVRGY